MSVRSLASLNDNILVSMHVDVSGYRPILDEVYRIGLLPLDEQIRPCKVPLFLELKPKTPEYADAEVLESHKQSFSRICKEGIDQKIAKKYLIGWFKELGLIEGKWSGKKIVILTYNYDMVKNYMLKWLDDEYHEMFMENVRDLKPIIGFLNDVKGYGNQRGKFVFDSLTSVRSYYGIKIPAIGPLQWAQIYAACYRELLAETNLF